MKVKNIPLTATDKVLLKIFKGLAYVLFFAGCLQGIAFIAFEFGTRDPFVAQAGSSPLLGMFFLASAMALNFGVQNRELRAQI